MSPHAPRSEEVFLTRRQLLQRAGTGIGSLGLATLLSGENLLASPASSANPMTPKPPHFAPRAKYFIHLFMNGGPSQVDTFDPKPALQRHAGKTLPRSNLRTERRTGAALPSPFEFKRYGKSGIEVSELFSHVAESIDDICVIRSVHGNVPNHGPSFLLMNCGDSRFERPSMGSWLTYGLGTENQNLPGFTVLCPGVPTEGSRNWQSSFLPGVHQGVHLETNRTEVESLLPNIRNKKWTLPQQRRQLDLVRELNDQFGRQRANEAALDARIQSFELAYRMQMAASDAFDLSKEPAFIHDLYGKGFQGRQMLTARRLVERGVRVVQVYHGGNQPWDSHEDIEREHRRLAGECDQAIGALLKDLKQRGLLDETLVLWGGEFGRTPVVELAQGGNNFTGKGRDHNHHGFSVWLAGGGVKGGTVYGATDEFGFKAVENRMHVHDLHATILHLMGIDHEQLTYRYSGRDFRLTDVSGTVAHEIFT